MKNTLNTKEAYALILNLADIYSVQHGELIPLLGQYIDTPIIEDAVQKRLLYLAEFAHDLILDNIAIAEGTYEALYIPMPGDIKRKLMQKRLKNRQKRKQRK